MKGRKIAFGIVALSTIALAGCASSPRTVELDRTYALVDADGRVAGHAEFTPLGDGSIVDTHGTVIGRVTRP